MYTPHGGGPDRRAETASAKPDLSAFEYYASAVAGLVATGLVVVFLYPTVVGMTAPLEMLSSTAIVFVLLFVWLLLWSGVELVWAWGARRSE